VIESKPSAEIWMVEGDIRGVAAQHAAARHGLDGGLLEMGQERCSGERISTWSSPKLRRGRWGFLP
jgi:hypothetical protein